MMSPNHLDGIDGMPVFMSGATHSAAKMAASVGRQSH